MSYKSITSGRYSSLKGYVHFSDRNVWFMKAMQIKFVDHVIKLPTDILLHIFAKYIPFPIA